MGQAVRKCAAGIDEMTASCGCPEGDGYLSPHRQRLQELVNEVEDARQENHRLSRQAHRLKVAVQDMRPDAAALNAQDRGMGGMGRSPQADQALNEELLRLKRVLWDLQRENAQLKEGSRGGTPGGGGGPEMQALMRQVDELQRAYDSSVREAEMIKQQQRSMMNSGSMYGSGRVTPSTTGGFSSDDEVRRRVQAIHMENEQLKKKVRMLATA